MCFGCATVAWLSIATALDLCLGLDVMARPTYRLPVGDVVVAAFGLRDDVVGNGAGPLASGQGELAGVLVSVEDGPAGCAGEGLVAS
jgi:hypothetical protein